MSKAIERPYTGQEAPLPESAPRGLGRPRSSAFDELVLRTVLRQLARDGYAQMSIQSVADEAGISRPSIYLRWPSKRRLVAAALAMWKAGEPDAFETTGDTRADLIRFLTTLRKEFDDIGLGLSGSLWAEEYQNPELITSYREQAILPVREVIRTILRSGADAGEFQAGRNIDAAVQMLVGSLYAAFIAAEQDRLDIASVVDIVLSGLRRRM